MVPWEKHLWHLLAIPLYSHPLLVAPPFTIGRNKIIKISFFFSSLFFAGICCMIFFSVFLCFSFFTSVPPPLSSSSHLLSSPLIIYSLLSHLYNLFSSVSTLPNFIKVSGYNLSSAFDPADWSVSLRGTVLHWFKVHF